jgi:polar amino acid transport system substrate-binding protein
MFKLRFNIVFILFVLIALALNAQAQSSVQAALAQEQLSEAKKANCGFKPELDSLEEILCNGEIKIGVRSDYRLFSELKDGTYSGYEIDIADAIAKKLGVQAKFIPVTSSNQIRRLAAGEVDMILATMAHTTERDKVVHSIRPHYYASPTTIVGKKNTVVRDWSDLREKAICVPIGNFSNIEFSKRKEGHKLMIYGDPAKLIQALGLGACSFIAHDQSYVRAYITGPNAPPDMKDRFDEKVSFFEVPWAIGVGEEAKESLGRWLSLTLADMHQTGVLVELAAQHGVENSFLEFEKKRWSQSPCNTLTVFDQKCLISLLLKCKLYNSYSFVFISTNIQKNYLPPYFFADFCNLSICFFNKSYLPSISLLTS